MLIDSDEDMGGGVFQDATGEPVAKNEKYISKENENKCNAIMQKMYESIPATKGSSQEDILVAQKKCDRPCGRLKLGMRLKMMIGR